MCIFVQSVKLYIVGPWKMVVIFCMKPVINLAKMLPLKHKSKQNCMNIWKSVRAWIFPGFLFATAKVASITVLIFFHIILHPTVLIYDFHIFITSSSSFHGFIMNQFNNLLPVGFLAQLVERCTWYCRVQGFESCTSLNFFRLSFRNCKSCVYNCDDLLSYNNSSPRICHYDLHIFIT